ncbi:1,2-phenylacetyl-CoA epoxidase subunit PaaC [Nitrincola alkalilacustris]|uniref:1,2-phenylacetyl-CoA epoxidase subunit PaaC n=1 Tax=Nitrincola alkalilacustris TaxID=1571224 RepID=UPI00124DD9E5|nr:1,2-phenylacetyl-CoA epoxidase subunit PaaC [Nitrincola alkalilacustris]
MTQQEALQQYLLRLADSDMVLGQRLCELCGHAPALEEELALMNLGLDLIGQARNWYEYAAELEGKGNDADYLAFRRDAGEFRNLLLVEQPNGDYAMTMARQFFFDAWHYQTLQALVNSSDERIAQVAGKAIKEVTYHLRRSIEWMKRLGNGTEESHQRMEVAVEELWRFTGELIEADEVDLMMAEAGIGADPEAVKSAWKQMVTDVMTEATLTLQDENAWMHVGGKRGIHTEHLGFLLAEMQFLPRAYPDAVW